MTSNEQSHEIITQLPTSEVETCRVKTANVANHCPALKLICFIIYIYMYTYGYVYIYMYSTWNGMLSINITSCSAPVCCAGLHTSMSSPQQLFVSRVSELSHWSAWLHREDSVKKAIKSKPFELDCGETSEAKSHTTFWIHAIVVLDTTDQLQVARRQAEAVAIEWLFLLSTRRIPG